MSDIELKNNFEKFTDSWTGILDKNIKALRKDPQFAESFARVAAFNSLRVDVIEPKMSKEAYLFVKEAHHDLLIAHTNAMFGSKRSALQSLRSFLENTMMGLFFQTHPIEQQKWLKQSFRIAPAELRKFFSEHPALKSKDVTNFKDAIGDEYAVLSKSVHASAKNVRMVNEDSKGLLWTSEAKELDDFFKHEKKSIATIGFLIFVIYSEQLSGTKLPNTRQAFSKIFDATQKSLLRDGHSVKIS